MSPALPTAVITCMDARLDAFEFFDPLTVVHALRTAGGG